MKHLPQYSQTFLVGGGDETVTVSFSDNLTPSQHNSAGVQKHIRRATEKLLSTIQEALAVYYHDEVERA